jgi:hypothetical protein
VNAENFRRWSEAIAWSQHGGSGLNFTRADMLIMSAADLLHAVKSVNERREREADALRKAHGGSNTRTIGPPV